MTAWVTALVPLLVALVSAARWPTLGKRIRDHAALVKELPPDAAKELQALLLTEVRSLAERDRRRLDRRVDWWLNARRVGLTVLLLAAVFGVIWLVSFLDSALTSAGERFDEMSLAFWAFIGVTTGGVLTVAASAASAAADGRKRRAAERSDMDAEIRQAERQEDRAAG
ncbi:hypothetical protein SAMN05660642_04636 [Geodermatophilus siccatus]|uniref:Uncharacterized protein n=1 Tax=Geodermatophilus siccatus TaxID=1137991 RepID=A0A1H0AQ43_9ACTN|nr:hypothetical protein [Geodermatophilus siccatus]SDN35086.1 hypothetical protein SAMN05660642_04636 [Geodermatophilus siccatus]